LEIKIGARLAELRALNAGATPPNKVAR